MNRFCSIKIAQSIFVMIFAVTWTGCTRGNKSNPQFSISFSAKRNSTVNAATDPNAPVVKHIVINISDSATKASLMAPFNWDSNCHCPANTDQPLPDPITLTVDSGPGRLIQVLAVLQDPITKASIFEYGETPVDLSAGDSPIINVTTDTKLGSGSGAEANIFGRVKTTAGLFPTGHLVMKYTPPGKPTMTIQSQDIFGGWFSLFAIDGANFDYILESSGETIFPSLGLTASGSSLSINGAVVAPANSLAKIMFPSNTYYKDSTNTCIKNGGNDTQAFLGFFAQGGTLVSGPNVLFQSNGSTSTYIDSTCSAYVGWNTASTSTGVRILGGLGSSSPAGDNFVDYFHMTPAFYGGGGSTSLAQYLGPYKLFTVASGSPTAITVDISSGTSSIINWSYLPGIFGQADSITGSAVFIQPLAAGAATTQLYGDDRFNCANLPSQGFNAPQFVSGPTEQFNTGLPTTQRFQAVICPYTGTSTNPVYYSTVARTYFQGAMAFINVSNSGMPSNPQIGSNNSVTYTITNNGNMTVTGVGVSGITAPLSLVSTTCGSTLTAGSSCTVDLNLTPATVGNQNGAAIFTYNDGANKTLALAWNITATPTILTVAELYSAAPNWNDYAKDDGTNAFNATNTACNSSTDTKCLHGGELRKVVTTYTSCANLAMDDSLNAFNWVCRVANGFAEFASIGLKPGKGLRDLVTATNWRPNHIDLKLSGTVVGTSPAAAIWWGNTVMPAPGSDGATYASPQTLGAASTIYTVPTGVNAINGGYIFGANKVGLVTLGNANLEYNTSFSGYNCNSNASRCEISFENYKFLWLEVNSKLSGGSFPWIGLYTSSGAFSRINNTSITGLQVTGGNYGMFINSAKGFVIRDLQLGPSGSGFSATSLTDSVVDGLTTQGNYQEGIVVNSSNNVTFNRVISSNNNNYGVKLYSSNTNISLVNALVTNNANDGIFNLGLSAGTLMNITSANNNNTGINFSSGSTNNNTLLGLLLVNNLGEGLSFASGSASNEIFGNIMSTHNTNGLVNYGTSNSALGTFYFGNNSALNCSMGTAVAGLSGTCSTSGGIVASTNWSLLNAFIGKLSATDPVNLTNSGGASSHSTITDWLNFAFWGRAWGKQGAAFPSSTNSGVCLTGTCNIWDWRLAASDTASRGVNGTFVAGSACPTSVHGSTSTTSGAGLPMLINATELLGTGGNNDGTCNSNESCVFSPNFGAYQGEPGTLSSAPCLFTDGTITGVTMYGYTTNGGT